MRRQTRPLHGSEQKKLRNGKRTFYEAVESRRVGDRFERRDEKLAARVCRVRSGAGIACLSAKASGRLYIGSGERREDGWTRW